MRQVYSIAFRDRPAQFRTARPAQIRLYWSRGQISCLCTDRADALIMTAHGDARLPLPMPSAPARRSAPRREPRRGLRDLELDVPRDADRRRGAAAAADGEHAVRRRRPRDARDRAAARRGVAERAREWLRVAPIGALLFLGGNGFVAIAEQSVSSGGAAVVCATMPLWVGVLGGGHAASGRAAREWLSLALGFVGVRRADGRPVARGQAGAHRALIVLADRAGRSARSCRAARLAESPARHASCRPAMQMLDRRRGAARRRAALRGERLPAHASAHAWLALGYLVVFGSLIGVHRVQLAAAQRAAGGRDELRVRQPDPRGADRRAVSGEPLGVTTRDRQRADRRRRRARARQVPPALIGRRALALTWRSQVHAVGVARRVLQHPPWIDMTQRNTRYRVPSSSSSVVTCLRPAARDRSIARTVAVTDSRLSVMDWLLAVGACGGSQAARRTARADGAAASQAVTTATP